MFTIVRCGYDSHHPEGFRIYRPQGTDDYLAVLFRSPIRIIQEEAIENTQHPCLIIYKKHSVHNYTTNGCEMIADWFHFTMDSSDFFQGKNIEFNKLYYPTSFHALSGVVKNIHRQKIFSQCFQNEILNNLAEYFFLLLAESLQTHSPAPILPEQAHRLSQLRSRIYTNPQQAWNIPLMARELHISEPYFKSIYKKFFGVSPITDVIQSRMERAAYLLSADPSCSISKIAELCGYNSDVHFIRQFKKFMGAPPGRYRTSVL